MKRRVGVAWMLLLGVSLGAKPWRIATYNLENYGEANRLTGEGYREDYPKPEAAKAALRRVMREVAADIWVLQEVGSAAHLNELRRDLAAEGLAYEQALVVEAADEARHVAVLARGRGITVLAHPTVPAASPWGRVKRGLVEVQIAGADGALHLFGFHLKSRWTAEAGDPEAKRQREAEAEGVRAWILREAGVHPWALLGDANDAWRSRPLRAWQKQGTTPLSRLLPAVDDRGTEWTYWWRREGLYQRVDYVLVSVNLAQPGRAWLPAESGVGQASDHRPVVWEVEWPQFAKMCK